MEKLGTLLGLRLGQVRPWVGSGLHYYQRTVPHFNSRILKLGKLVDAACYVDTFSRLLLALHRTLVCGDV